MTESTGFDAERAKSYDDRVRQHIPGYEILHALAETIFAAELPADASLLIGGVGTGMEILEWAPKHPGWRFLGVDPSEAMVAQAAQKTAAASLASRAAFKVATLESLPEGAEYDAATLLLALHFVPDNGHKEAILAAIAHRLKPGAPFLIATMFGDPESTRHKRLIGLTKSWALARGMAPAKAEELYDPSRKDLHIVPEERLKNLLRYTGFIDVQRVYQALTIGLWLARTPRE